jgi:TDG/mug DNA glycosylase family protein
MAAILPPLKDRVRRPVRVLFVGINPGIRSATIGHHFAGYSNRFWKLLYDARIVDEPIGAVDDGRLAEWGLGITNLISRATPGIDTLEPSEYGAGERILRRKVRRWKPDIVAFVGVTLFRAVFGRRPGDPIQLGRQRETFEGSRVFVLPNPSGRNANFSYEDMLSAFRQLRRQIRAFDASPIQKPGSRRTPRE